MTLSVRDLHYRYGATEVLKGIDLDVASGEIVCLVGPNGAGKSTVIKCLNGIFNPTQGSIHLDGVDVASLSRRALAKFVAYVPQQTGSAMSLQVMEMVGLGRAPHRGLGTSARDEQVVIQAIRILQLEALATRQFAELSGGERHRVLIARALAQEAQVMLLDEPTSDLDLGYQLEIVTVLRRLAAERQVAQLIAIHDLSLAGRIADRIVMLSGGRIHAQGKWADVMTPENLETVYGVSAVTGFDNGLPYVLPMQRT